MENVFSEPSGQGAGRSRIPFLLIYQNKAFLPTPAHNPQIGQEQLIREKPLLLILANYRTLKFPSEPSCEVKRKCLFPSPSYFLSISSPSLPTVFTLWFSL